MNMTLNAGLPAAICCALALTACASAPQAPSGAFQAADMAIAGAERDKAAEFAPMALKSARDKMSLARNAMIDKPKDRDAVRARQLAEEAQADAEFASAKAHSVRAAAVNSELQDNIDTLRDELQRSTGGKS